TEHRFCQNPPATCGHCPRILRKTKTACCFFFFSSDSPPPHTAALAPPRQATPPDTVQKFKTHARGDSCSCLSHRSAANADIIPPRSPVARALSQDLARGNRLPLFFIMSTLCCAVLVEGGGVPGNAEPLSPMRIAIPAVNVSGELSCEDSPVTTPEASTDSDDCDSAFESDDDGRGVLPIGGRRRKAPSRPDGNNRWPGCVTTTASTNNTNGDKIIGRKTRQPTPLRKVRFTLHDEQHHTPRHPSEKNVRGLGGVPSAGARARYRSWGRERRAAIQASALQDVGMLARPEHQQQQHRRSPAGGEKESTAASTTFTTTNNNNNCDRTRARKKRATAAAPFKSTSANVSTTNTPHASSVAAPVAALVRVAPSFSSVPVPVSTKKRKMSTIA
ncbi:unnamed protein product, partial [Scytosiphon promiscuus]